MVILIMANELFFLHTHDSVTIKVSACGGTAFGSSRHIMRVSLAL